jgi:hypothetical protein
MCLNGQRTTVSILATKIMEKNTIAVLSVLVLGSINVF